MNENLMFTDETVKLITIVADRSVSTTQTIKTVIIEKNGQKFISLQKWWRKTVDEPWREGKGFHFSVEEASTIVEDLKVALKLLSDNNLNGNGHYLSSEK